MRLWINGAVVESRSVANVVWFAQVLGENVGRVLDTFDILNRDNASRFLFLNEAHSARNVS